MAGVYWERHCHARLKEAGFEKIPGWECTFFHRKLQLFLSVYVDDFKLAGKKENLSAGWKAITSAGIKLDEASKLDHYL